MADLRGWQLPFDEKTPLLLAADARMSSTNLKTDAVWEVHPGTGESAAMALYTRYGGRAGLVSLVPMWTVNDALVYQAAQFTGPTTIRAFTPDFAQLQTKITPTLALLAEFWAMESSAIGGRFTLHSTSKQPQEVRLDMLGFVGIDGREMPTKVIFIPGERHALSLGVIRDLTPILMLENGYALPESGGNKVSAVFALAPGAKTTMRFVCASTEDARASLSLAKRWLMQDWGPYFKRFSVASTAIPRIETGDASQDAALAVVWMQLVQGFMHTGEGEAPQSMAARGAKGARVQRDPHAVYESTLAAAAVDPTLAQGVVQRILATQRDDGWVDAEPPIGTRPTLLYVPILARLAWSIFQYSEDSAFLQAVYPALRRFFARWLAPDLDVDGDGAPEWQSTAQMGMMTRLNLASIRVNARRVETPGLMAHLLSEALSLREMAHYLRDDAAEAEYAAQVERLRSILETFWDGEQGRYATRDRDTHHAAPAQTLLQEGEGDADHLPVIDLTTPARVVVLVEGGFTRTPSFTLTVQGIAPDGREVVETVDSAAFEWETGRGYYTTEAVFTRLDRVRCDGLVRVYKVSAFTPDLTMEDADSLLPLWSAGIPRERATRVLEQLQRFVRDGAIYADPVSSERPPRLYSALNTLLGEGMLEYGDARVLAIMAGMLRAGSGTDGTKKQTAANSAVHGQAPYPLHLSLRVLGVRVISKTKVWTGGAFLWGSMIRVTHKGVLVERSADGTRVTFPSKRVVELPPDAPWQEVIDTPPPQRTLKKRPPKKSE